MKFRGGEQWYREKGGKHDMFVLVRQAVVKSRAKSRGAQLGALINTLQVSSGTEINGLLRREN